MRINSVRSKEADVTLNADELVAICNIMYMYEKNIKVLEPGSKGPRGKYHELAASMVIARDLCQYGNLDAFSLGQVVKYKIAANPESRLAKFVDKDGMEKEDE